MYSIFGPRLPSNYQCGMNLPGCPQSQCCTRFGMCVDCGTGCLQTAGVCVSQNNDPNYYNSQSFFNSLWGMPMTPGMSSPIPGITTPMMPGPMTPPMSPGFIPPYAMPMGPRF
jgi:hypothetical protein